MHAAGSGIVASRSGRNKPDGKRPDGFRALDGTRGTVLQFGGSGTDEIQDLAVTPDGRVVMAGMTSSSDGTLSDRTREGQSGWGALVDLQGNTCWNFCSRYGSNDRMKAPVVHADGTITVLLETKGGVYDQVELIRLDAAGNVLSRKPLAQLTQEGSAYAPEEPGVFCGGYVIATIDSTKKIDFEPVYRYSKGVVYQPVYHFFDFDGNLLFETQAIWQNGIAQTSRAHVIEAIDQMYWLCALDAQRVLLAEYVNGGVAPSGEYTWDVQLDVIPVVL